MKNLFKALADFQQEVPVIYKDSQAYGYKYADLPKIFEVINPIMKKNGLGFTQLIKGTNLETIVFHVESGECLESSLPIPQGVQLKGMNEFQVLGSAISYLRRYSISSILGLISDKDIDVQGEQVKPKQKPTMDDARFTKAMESIAKGTYTVEQLKSSFTLSKDQIGKL